MSIIKPEQYQILYVVFYKINIKVKNYYKLIT